MTLYNEFYINFWRELKKFRRTYPWLLVDIADIFITDYCQYDINLCCHYNFYKLSHKVFSLFWNNNSVVDVDWCQDVVLSLTIRDWLFEAGEDCVSAGDTRLGPTGSYGVHYLAGNIVQTSGDSAGAPRPSLRSCIVMMILLHWCCWLLDTSQIAQIADWRQCHLQLLQLFLAKVLMAIFRVFWHSLNLQTFMTFFTEP